MKKIIPAIIGLIAIVVSIYAIFKLLPTELAVNFITISFGLLALIWAYKAFRSLAPNSSLRSYSLLFALGLTLMVVFRILTVLPTIIVLSSWYNNISYIAIIFGYLLLAVASYKILEIGKEFGFADSASTIAQALKEKKKKRLCPESLKL